MSIVILCGIYGCFWETFFNFLLSIYNINTSTAINFFKKIQSIIIIIIVGEKVLICTLGLKPYLLMLIRSKRSI